MIVPWMFLDYEVNCDFVVDVLDKRMRCDCVLMLWTRR